MAAYKIPTDQLEKYKKSVHWKMMTSKGDLLAPTCNDCHGNHGATPPGVGSVANVCGTCHAIFAQKFATSVHQQIFDKACVECHSNHAVLKPSDEWLGTRTDAICATCHSGNDDKGAVAAARMRGDIERLRAGLERSGGLMARLKNAGIEQLVLTDAKKILELYTPEVHALYHQMVTKSDVKLEVLPIEYFRQIALQLSFEADLITLFKESRIIAFGWALRHANAWLPRLAGAAVAGLGAALLAQAI